ncbi:MAG: bifunctional 4-hydroxy-2-oxoglutarate aldolase/2-dehydro-3-deoxy-phosphogluconate aldolase [Candidatus Omnitrophica bacterium]|nr:bifunctional 4-hydroxy-2-oxoglutarate aldolase/2-dehydro-3-deoxy-phosphogluconate aldolase [Candidatus Omnitrophota bacterium]
MKVEIFKKLPIMAIIRGIETSHLSPLIETVMESGLKTIEITMNTQAAPELIRRARKISNGKLTIGAGTVIQREDLSAALEAGAQFVVMPVCFPEIVTACAQRKIPVFPGALTPKEIYEAWKAGATMVKIFPANRFGPPYFREIKGPFNGIDLLACGGVNPENLADYFKCGASAVTFGSSIFRKEWIESGKWDLIGEKIKAFVKAYEELKT